MDSGNARELVSETTGTALLLTCVIGSGIMGERLSGGNAALTLLANSLATGAALVALLITFGPISGAHFNPAVTLCGALLGDFPWAKVPGYLIAQLAGAFLGVALAHWMFGLPAFSHSHHARHALGQVLGECLATFGLVATVLGSARQRPIGSALAVGAYVLAAYWFTSSTSFANPAVTLARSASDTFAGIRGQDVAGFIAAQLAGACAAAFLFKWLSPRPVPGPVGEI